MFLVVVFLHAAWWEAICRANLIPIWETPVYGPGFEFKTGQTWVAVVGVTDVLCLFLKLIHEKRRKCLYLTTHHWLLVNIPTIRCVNFETTVPTVMVPTVPTVPTVMTLHTKILINPSVFLGTS